MTALSRLLGLDDEPWTSPLLVPEEDDWTSPLLRDEPPPGWRRLGPPAVTPWSWALPYGSWHGQVRPPGRSRSLDWWYQESVPLPQPAPTPSPELWLLPWPPRPASGLGPEHGVIPAGGHVPSAFSRPFGLLGHGATDMSMSSREAATMPQAAAAEGPQERLEQAMPSSDANASMDTHFSKPNTASVVPYPLREIESFASKLKRAYEIGDQTYQEAERVAYAMIPDWAAAKRSLANGVMDAWRHAEWNRRMAQELGPDFASMVGFGYEALGMRGALGNVASRTKPDIQRFIDRSKATAMDLTNNRYGRRSGSTPISPADPDLVYYPDGDVRRPRSGPDRYQR